MRPCWQSSWAARSVVVVELHDISGVLIDGSNVCRDRSISPRGADAAWERLEFFLHSLGNALPPSSLYVVADRSLFPRLDARGKQCLKDLRGQGCLEEVKFADERLLELAFSDNSPRQGAVIATMDRFDDFRRRYPELDAAKAIAWSTDSKGEPVPEFRPFGPRPHHQVSRKEEAGELYERGLRRYEVENRAASRYFRCRQEKCLLAELWPDRLEELPRYDQDHDCFVCPGCKTPLDDAGPRPPAVAVIVFFDEVERGRFLIEDGPGVMVGRTRSKRCIGLEELLPGSDLALISRTHIKLSIDGGNVTVEDLDSKNGTRIGDLESDSTTAKEIPAGRASSWPLDCRIILPSRVALERSGRRHPISGKHVDNSLPNEPSGPPTVRADRPPTRD